MELTPHTSNTPIHETVNSAQRKAGGIASLVCGLTYIFGFVLFFGLIEAPVDGSESSRLTFLLSQRDTFFMGYIVIGIVFSLGLILLNQSLLKIFESTSPIAARFNSSLGNIWATFVLASTFIFLVSLPSLANYANTSEGNAVVVLNSVDIVIDALGGGIELLGALWVLLISYMGIKANKYAKTIHIMGVVVGIAGVLTLFSGISFLETVPLFEATTAIFGLGQIVWFFALANEMIKPNN